MKVLRLGASSCAIVSATTGTPYPRRGSSTGEQYPVLSKTFDPVTFVQLVEMVAQLQSRPISARMIDAEHLSVVDSGARVEIP
jgi:hypothetical protein